MISIVASAHITVYHSQATQQIPVLQKCSMVVGYDPRQRELSAAQVGIASFFASTVTRATVQPLDVLKIRFEVRPV